MRHDGGENQFSKFTNVAGYVRLFELESKFRSIYLNPSKRDQNRMLITPFNVRLFPHVDPLSLLDQYKVESLNYKLKQFLRHV